VKITYKIVCSSGVLAYGMTSDFLGAIYTARQLKKRFISLFPHSVIRVQLLYPNNRRVPSEDIKAALRALADAAVYSAVRIRVAQALATGTRDARSAPSRPVASALAQDFDVAVGSAFSQAGVVAPPDSPDLGNSLDLVCSFQGS